MEANWEAACVSSGEKIAVRHGGLTQSEALFIRTRWLAVALTVLSFTRACGSDGRESENTQFSTTNVATVLIWRQMMERLDAVLPLKIQLCTAIPQN
jgi:hypothetical protein